MNLLLDPSVVRPILLLLHVFSAILAHAALAQPSSVPIGTTFDPDLGSTLLVSPGENLFSLELRIWPDSATRYCMCGVQYKKKESSAAIWSFSADQQPAEGSTCELALSTDGELSLYNEPGHAVWTSGTAGSGVQNMALREDGNLVLTDEAGNMVWQSFTAFDSIFILPSGMNFTRNTMLFEAVGVPRSPSFSTRGEHALVLSASGHLQLVLVELMFVYHSFDPSGVNASLVDHIVVGDAIEFYYDDAEPSSSGAIATIPSNRGQGLDPSFPRRLGFVMEGNFVINYWNGSKNVRYYNSSVDTCYMPKSCRGHYKLCSSNGGATNNITCKCPPGFQANSSGDCNPRDYRHNMKPVNVAFRRQIFAQRVASQAECGALCAANTTCNAALFDASASSCSLFPILYTIPEAPQGAETPNPQVLLLKVPKPRPLSRAAVAAAAAAAATLLLLALLLLSLLAMRRRRRRRESADERFLQDLPRLPPRFAYKELRAATRDFCKKLGAGGFGTVYEGELSTGVKIAVKMLSEGGGGGGSREQFEAEVGTIGSVSHVNLVRLRGFCMEGRRRLLVYEFMARGSLDRWLFKNKNKNKNKNKDKGDGDGDGVANGDGDGMVVANGDGDGDVVLDWATRCSIALDTARGLEYLHHQCGPDHIVHCDVKPENILLDHGFGAKVADFGLAKLVHGHHQGFMITTLKGTRGYLAPEWLQETSITPKSDVYSFGVVLLELVTGRRCLDPDVGHLPMWALRVARSSCASSSSSQTDAFSPTSDLLMSEDIGYSSCLNALSPPNGPTSRSMGYDVERVEDVVLDDRLDRRSVGAASFERLFTLALACVRTDPAIRPSMASVVQVLEAELVDWWKPDWPATVEEPSPVATPLAVQSRALLHSTIWRSDDYAPTSQAYPYSSSSSSSTLQVTGPR